MLHPRFDHRLDVLERAAAGIDWLDVRVTDAQLIVDVARGFDVVIMGADKWAQINEPKWYASATARDAAIASLPEIAVAPRPPHPLPDELTLTVDHDHSAVSSSMARRGAVELMLPAARSFAGETGAWIDHERYEDWAAQEP